MDAKKLVTGAVAGAVAQMVFGFLIFQWLFGGFYEANASGSAALMRESGVFWAWILGNLSLAVLVTLAVSHTGSESLAKGFLTGGVVGFLVWLGADFILYSGLELMSLTATVVDPFLEFVRTGITGALVGLVLARFPRVTPAVAG